jgi:ABC-type transport system involved in cytochrome c biogenesis permease subunit
MDQFSPAELLELLYIRESVIDTQFQYWITITFAVIAAGFVAGKRLNKRLRRVVASLYLLATVVLVSRWYYAGVVDVAQLSGQLQELGVSFNIPWVTIIARVVLIAFGTSAALIFLLSEKLCGEPDS